MTGASVDEYFSDTRREPDTVPAPRVCQLRLAASQRKGLSEKGQVVSADFRRHAPIGRHGIRGTHRGSRKRLRYGDGGVSIGLWST